MIYWVLWGHFVLNEWQRHETHGDRSFHRSIFPNITPEPMSLLDESPLK